MTKAKIPFRKPGVGGFDHPALLKGGSDSPRSSNDDEYREMPRCLVS